MCCMQECQYDIMLYHKDNIAKYEKKVKKSVLRNRFLINTLKKGKKWNNI